MLDFLLLHIIILVLILIYYTFRLSYLILRRFLCIQSIKQPKPTTRTIIVIGSGGHTTEMLRLVNTMNKSKFTPRLYILADSDMTSQVHIENAESGTDWSIVSIPRSRSVNQSYLTSILSTIHSTITTAPEVLSFKPDIVLCNGPGTCIPVCFVAFLMILIEHADISIIFVESICRVYTLSLTGKILYFIADLIIVQWPELKRNYGERVKYLNEGLSI